MVRDGFLTLPFVYINTPFCVCVCAAPEATQVGEHTITQKHLYTGLFVIGIPLFWWAGPFGTFFWLIGASSILVLGHASLLEPGVESDYATIQETV
jgi:PRA1 family protein 1